MLTPAELRRRLLASPEPAPECAAGSEAEDGRDLVWGPPIPAAVLVPILAMPDRQAVLLTKRTAHLAAHAGQVSFPGGRIDPSDQSPEHAALREAEEEIGLGRAGVEVLGRLPDYVTATGFALTPVLGWLTAPPELTPSEREVEAVFWLDLHVLLDPGAPQRRLALFREQWRPFWVWPHPDHHIWGATAAILVHLAKRLQQGGGEAVSAGSCL